MVREINEHIQEAQRIPKRINLKKTTLRNIITKFLKTKENILEAAREKQHVTPTKR